MHLCASGTLENLGVKLKANSRFLYSAHDREQKEVVGGRRLPLVSHIKSSRIKTMNQVLVCERQMVEFNTRGRREFPF